MSRSTNRSGQKTDAVRIQDAAPLDVPAMLTVVNAAFFEVETFLDGPRTDGDQLRAMMEKGTFILAKDADGEIVAAVYTELRGDRGYFGMLAVDPSRQGTGLGRMMVQTVENHFRSRGCGHVDISVLSLRTELFGFYSKLGYSESGTAKFARARLLKPGVVCEQILMSKRL